MLNRLFTLLKKSNSKSNIEFVSASDSDSISDESDYVQTESGDHCKKESISIIESDYVRTESCDHCKKESISIINVRCNKCISDHPKEITTLTSNEFKSDDMYHCLDCLGQYYLNLANEEDRGFDLCKKCYETDPKWVTNSHQTNHRIELISRESQITPCKICDFFICHDCRLLISETFKIRDIYNINGMNMQEEDYDNNTFEQVITICNKCLKQIQKAKLNEMISK